MNERFVSHLLDRFDSADSAAAWSDFLQTYAPYMLQIARLHERDDDRVSDCFLFVCQELSRRRFRRLRRYRADGAASFGTWLRVVVRNLCLDWRRKQSGRPRIFHTLARLSSLDQEVFRCFYQDGLGPEETLATLRPLFPGLGPQRLAESRARVAEHLTPRQRWLAQARLRKTESIDGASNGPTVAAVRDPSPDPEALAAQSELRERLNGALAGLSAKDRLLLRLRFEQSLTLEQVARLTGLTNAQQADRRIREVVQRLRSDLTGGAVRPDPGNARGPSV